MTKSRVHLYNPHDDALRGPPFWFDETSAPGAAMSLALPEWPLFGLADDVRPAMRTARAAGETVALATLYAVGEGGPRPPGSQLLLTPSAASGYLSGGCIEADIALHAAEVIAGGEPRHLVYGEGSAWPDIQLLCGTRLDILLEQVTPDDPALAALLAAAEARRPVVWVTDGRTRQLESTVAAPMARRQTCAAPFELRRRYDPVARLVVFGSDPIALATASLGAQSGFETTLVRPRGPLAPPPLMGVTYNRANPGAALREIVPDPWTAVAVATHDWELDHEALVAALPSAARYVGVVGARRRVPERLARLRAAGVGEAALARLRAPIGLDLGGKAPWEIAVSVIAQIIAEQVEPSIEAVGSGGGQTS
jgi:xanthine dehydrogenase accessory factor